MKKTPFIISLSAAFIFVGLFQTAIAAVSVNEKGFSDLSGAHPNYNAIMDLQVRGIVSGYPDGTFMPDRVVNRAEALKIILEGSEIQGLETAVGANYANFSDVTDWNAWYYPYLNAAVHENIVEGYPDGTFKPDSTVNLAENLKMLLLAKKVDLSTINIIEDPYTDVAKNAWFAKYAKYAKDRNLIESNELGKIYPSQGMTRGKLAEVMYRLIFADEHNLKSFPQGTLISGTGEPVSFSTAELDVSIFKKTVPVTNVFSANSLEAQSQDCGTNHDKGYFTELVSKLTGDVTTYTFIENKMAQNNEYVVTIMQNTPGYTDEAAFKDDFDVCVAGGTYPYKMSADWLIFVKNCSADFDADNQLPMGCAEMKSVIEPTLSFK